MRQVIYAIAFVLASFIIAPAQEEPRASRPGESDDPCSRFKMRVVSPPEDVDYKLRLVAPRTDIEYKLRVLNPCPKEELNVATLRPAPPPTIRSAPRTIRHHAPQPSGSDSFTKPPSFSYRLMPDTTRAAPDAPRRYEPKLKQFINHK